MELQWRCYFISIAAILYMWAQFWSEFYRRQGYNSRLKLQVWLENCLDVFTDSHFQVKFCSVLSLPSRCLFVSLISLFAAVFPCYKAGESLHSGRINQCYFFPFFHLWPDLPHPGHLLNAFNANKVPEQQARRSHPVMSVQDKIDKPMEWINVWWNYLWLG